MGIALQCLLDLQRQAVHAAAHVADAGGQPDPNTRRDRNHPRSTATIRRRAAWLTVSSTRTRTPPGNSISIEAGLATTYGAGADAGLGRGGCFSTARGSSTRRTGTSRKADPLPATAMRSRRHR